MAAKVCKKHKREFFGLRCPLCTASPVIHHDESDVPFATEQSDKDGGVRITPTGRIGTDEDTGITVVPGDPVSISLSFPDPAPDPAPDFGGFGGDSGGGGASSDF